MITDDFNDITSNEKKWVIGRERKEPLKTLGTSLNKMDSLILDLKVTPRHGITIRLKKVKLNKGLIELWEVMIGAKFLTEH